MAEISMEMIKALRDETGVAVMSLVKGNKTDTEQDPVGRIQNTQKLLASAALIMSVLVVLAALVADIAVAIADPRIRLS